MRQPVQHSHYRAVDTVKHTKSHMGTLTQRVAGAPPPGRPPTCRRLVSPSPPSLFTISRLGSLFYDNHNHHRRSSIIPERPVQSPAQSPAAAARQDGPPIRPPAPRPCCGSKSVFFPAHARPLFDRRTPIHTTHRSCSQQKNRVVRPF